MVVMMASDVSSLEKLHQKQARVYNRRGSLGQRLGSKSIVNCWFQ